MAKGVHSQEQNLDVRARVCSVLLSLLIRYADCLVARAALDDHPYLRSASVFEAAPERPAETRATPARYSRALSLVPAGGAATGAAVAAGPARDTPATLLAAFAVALESHASTRDAADDSIGPLADDLPSAARDAFLAFANFACRSPPLLEDQIDNIHASRRGWGPPSRAAYLQMLQAYACTPQAALQIVTQLVLHANHDDYEHLSWHDFFKVLAVLHDKYISVTAESRFTSPEGTSPTTVTVLLVHSMPMKIRCPVCRCHMFSEAFSSVTEHAQHVVVYDALMYRLPANTLPGLDVHLCVGNCEAYAVRV